MHFLNTTPHSKRSRKTVVTHIFHKDDVRILIYIHLWRVFAAGAVWLTAVIRVLEIDMLFVFFFKEEEEVVCMGNYYI